MKARSTVARPKLRTAECHASVDPELPARAPKPVTIRFGYQWQKDGESRQGGIWPCLRAIVSGTLKECEKRRAKRTAAQIFRHDFGRLRARHGSTLMGSIVERIRDADILIFDLSDWNRNVLFELGCAFGRHGLDRGNVFVLGTRQMLKSGETPSDLSGYFVTFHRPSRNGKGLELEEPRPFQNALRARIIEFARERGMWGELPARSEDLSEDEETLVSSRQ